MSIYYLCDGIIVVLCNWIFYLVQYISLTSRVIHIDHNQRSFVSRQGRHVSLTARNIMHKINLTSFVMQNKESSYFYCTVYRITSNKGRIFYTLFPPLKPPLWSSGQSFWLQIQRSRVRFPTLPDFLTSWGSGPGSTQPVEHNWEATWKKK
jgi:hypothetical protein